MNIRNRNRLRLVFLAFVMTSCFSACFLIPADDDDDPVEAVEKAIGPQGGKLEVGQIQLDIPPGALPGT